MPFTQISAHYTLDISTGLLSCCMKFSAIKTRAGDQSFFGAMLMPEVCPQGPLPTSNAHVPGRANAACILACYMVLIQDWPPHLALAPIAQMDPPCMPFRDAGYSQADYGIAVQDVVYGVWKAKEEKLCGLSKFSLEECVTSIAALTTN